MRLFPLRRMVAEVGVFRVGRCDGRQEYDDEGYPVHAFGKLGDAKPTGVWRVRDLTKDEVPGIDEVEAAQLRFRGCWYA